MRRQRFTKEPELTPNARVVLEKRYLKKDEQGRIQETPRQLFERVACAIAEAGAKGNSQSSALWAERFFELMVSRRFLPNSPTLMNAGKKRAQLSACFVLPVEDSLEGIFETLKQAAKIHQSGGGTGFSFSSLRGRGSVVRSTHGVASGPVSFMQIYDQATETIKQGGTRRGANMGVLRVDHPDIFEFIRSKQQQGGPQGSQKSNQKSKLTNFNISIGVTNEFMNAVGANEKFTLRDPQTKNPTRQVQAKELFAVAVHSAWETGDPGLVFLDRINLFNPTPRAGGIESTNPCGEQPLLAYESCNLGSLNLGMYWKNGAFDWNLLRQDVYWSVRFLDHVIDANEFPVVASARVTRKNRKIGLGVMGFADVLLMMGLAYEGQGARDFGEKVMSFIDREAKRASSVLARERGPFPNWKGSLWQRLGFPPLRNATVSTVAPTGTISMIAGCSSGIEPVFSAAYYKNVLGGEKLLEVHPAAAEKAWSPAHKISVEAHVAMQAVFQRSSDSAVSKTVNLPENASPDEVARAYLLAFELGYKGITVFRDKSRETQVLESVDTCLDC